MLDQRRRPEAGNKTALCIDIYQGGVDNLPKFFFMNELKEVVMADDGVREEIPRKRRCAVCCTEDLCQCISKHCQSQRVLV